MDYGVIINGQLITHKTPHPNDKPVVYTEVTVRENETACFRFVENNIEIVQQWTVSPSPYEPIAPDDDEATTEDYENALSEVGVTV